MKMWLHSVIGYIVVGLLKIQSKFRPVNSTEKLVKTINEITKTWSKLAAEGDTQSNKLPSLVEIFNNPFGYAEITEEAMATLEEEAYIAACEIQSPNSADFGQVREHQSERLQAKFWIKFMAQYRDLRMKGKV